MVDSADIHSTPYDPSFRMTEALELGDQEDLSGSHEKILGQINRHNRHIREYHSVHTDNLFRWLSSSGIAPENMYSNRTFIEGSGKLVNNSWCVWLSSHCYLYSWQHRLLLVYSMDTEPGQIENLSRIIEEHFLIKDFSNHLYLFYDNAFFESEIALFDLPVSGVSLDLHFNDDILDFAGHLVPALDDPKAGGIVVLSGLTGTGKTHFIRHLISVVKKRFLVYNPWCLDTIYTELYQEVKDAQQFVFVIEDVDDISDHEESEFEMITDYIDSVLKGRRVKRLKSPHIFTLNRPLTYPEQGALVSHPGLLGFYEFGPLVPEKAAALAASLGKALPEERAYTLGEVFHL
jgi:tRNA A37 threonylcarbamoyladenosine biosynthesis protein TsaE